MIAGGFVMRKSLATIVLMLLVIFAPRISEASWEFVYEHQNGVRVFADPDTCRIITGGLEIRTRRVIPAALQDTWSDGEAYSEATYQFNSLAHTNRIINIHFYNKTGQIIKAVGDSDWESYTAGSAVDTIYHFVVKKLGIGWKPPHSPVEAPAKVRLEPLRQIGGPPEIGRALIGVYQHSAECPIEIYQTSDGTFYGAYIYESPSAGRYYGTGKDRTDITLKNFRKIDADNWLVDAYLFSTRYPARILVQNDGVILDIIDLGSYFYKKIK
jgi:hypothetical protein